MTNPAKVRFSLAAAAAACIAAAASLIPAAAQTARPVEKITFLLDFTPYGKHAPFYAAIASTLRTSGSTTATTGSCTSCSAGC